MSSKIKLLISTLLFCGYINSQNVSAVYKINDLLERTEKNNDTIYVLNFWATWCVPCVKELPAIDSFATANSNGKVKVILVSLDFKDELDRKVNPFLEKYKYKTECILLDEVNGNDFIDKIDKRWTGSIPATFVTVNKRKKTAFTEHKVTKAELDALIEKVK